MINNQQLFELVCTRLRDPKNWHGNVSQRRWAWVNPYCPEERCALSQLVKGRSQATIKKNLRELMGYDSNDEIYSNKLINSIISLYDHYGHLIKTPQDLENCLWKIADKCDVFYFPPENKQTIQEVMNDLPEWINKELEFI